MNTENRHNCFSFVAKELNWATIEPTGLALDYKFRINDREYSLEKLLSLFAEHKGRVSCATFALGVQSNIVTFTRVRSENYPYILSDLERRFVDKVLLYGKQEHLCHIARIDPDDPLKLWQRKGWGKLPSNPLIDECGYLDDGYGYHTFLDYWKVPETEGMTGFLDNIEDIKVKQKFL